MPILTMTYRAVAMTAETDSVAKTTVFAFMFFIPSDKNLFKIPSPIVWARYVRYLNVSICAQNLYANTVKERILKCSSCGTLSQDKVEHNGPLAYSH
jgi:hypothetical protein